MHFLHISDDLSNNDFSNFNLNKILLQSLFLDLCIYPFQKQHLPSFFAVDSSNTRAREKRSTIVKLGGDQPCLKSAAKGIFLGITIHLRLLNTVEQHQICSPNLAPKKPILDLVIILQMPASGQNR